jgi:hypothetical protein
VVEDSILYIIEKPGDFFTSSNVVNGVQEFEALVPGLQLLPDALEIA